MEAFARAGYIGTVGGVNIYTKKDATKGTIVVATRQAVTIFNKKGVEVETDRNGDIRQNTIWSRKYYLAALTDATKAVKIFKGTATATARTIRFPRARFTTLRPTTATSLVSLRPTRRPKVSTRLPK